MMKDLYLHLVDNETGEQRNASILEIAENPGLVYHFSGEPRDLDIQIIELDEPLEVFENGVYEKQEGLEG